MAVLRGIAILALTLLPGIASLAAEPKSKLAQEYDLKAAFLFNFAQFVDWPPESFTDERSEFVIGVLGQDPFGKSLDEIVVNETAHDRKVVVRRCRTVQEGAKCHILFVSRSETPRLNDILEFLDGQSVLTVGEVDGFSARGGIINFYLAHNRLQVKINLVAAKAAKLTISSKLLRQAEIVDAKQGQ